LRVDDDSLLIDSHAILDWLAETLGPEAILMPARGADRRRVNQIVALIVGAQEKMIASIYHVRFIPEEKRHAPWVERVEGQARGGLVELDRVLAGDWFVGGRLTQADIAVAVGVSFSRLMLPHLAPEGRFPRLDELTRRCEALPAFLSTRPQG
jgi:glutathione S-transferase